MRDTPIVEKSIWHPGLITMFTLIGLAMLSFHTETAAQEGDQSRQVTFTEDVAPLLQENCQICHREGGIGPMALLNYQQARR